MESEEVYGFVIEGEEYEFYYHLMGPRSRVLEIGVLLKKSLLCHEVGKSMAECNGISFREEPKHQKFFTRASIDSKQEIKEAQERLIETVKDFQSL
ncbi:MAG: hypothetical protein GF370_01495 [Candidatus Nealsonbacteria bacterium]|nr:hypothetical protein [Candidatus Nealsonbacteria bacterium]